MSNIRISAANVPNALASRERLFKQELNKSLMRAAQRGKAHMRKVTPTDQGQMKNSWEVRRAGPKEVHLHNTAPYSDVVENGARPHPVSEEGRQAIYDWVRRNRHLFGDFVTKGGRVRPVKNVQRWKGDEITGESDPRIDRIVFFIIKRIKEKGVKGKHFIKTNMYQLNHLLGKEVNVAMDMAAKKTTNAEGGSR